MKVGDVLYNYRTNCTYIFIGYYPCFIKEHEFYCTLRELQVKDDLCVFLEVHQIVTDKETLLKYLSPETSRFYQETIKECSRFLSESYEHWNVEKELSKYLLKMRMLNLIEPRTYSTFEEIKSKRQEFKNKLREEYKLYIQTRIGNIFKFEKESTEYMFMGTLCDKTVFNDIYYNIPSEMFNVCLRRTNDNTDLYYSIEDFCNRIKIRKVGSKTVRNNSGDKCFRDYFMIKRDCKGLEYI